MSENVHIVPHMHWDREWYFTAEESKILLVNNMEEILEMLEHCPDYPYYVMDGQTAVLEDYLKLVPENRERLRSLVRSGRLIIGPWYIQTDEMVVGGESMVRNLLYGLRDCREFGPAMMIGYLPDSFGQSARLPQILNGFGIERCMFWRGTSERSGTDRTEFVWQDEDGSSVVVQLLPLGYAIGKYLPAEWEVLKNRMEKYLPVLDRGTRSGHILIPNGHDQMPIQQNIFQIIDMLKEMYPEKDFFLSKYEHVFEAIEETDLPVLKGEFLDGKYMRVHRSIYSSRADLKSANTRIENKITNTLEPLAAVAYSLGFEYHHGLMEEIWKELMKNHAHDSIGCCCSDKVHRAIDDRFFLAEERTDRLIEFYQRKIADTAASSGETLTVFQLLPYRREGVIRAEIITKLKDFMILTPDGGEVPYDILKTEIVDAGLIDRQLVHYEDYDPFRRYLITFCDRLPAMGYKSYLIREVKPEERRREPGGRSAAAEDELEEYLLENEFYAIHVERNGTLTVMEKATETVCHNVFLVEDGSDDGDGYDYSPSADDRILTSEQAEADICVVRGRHEQSAAIRYRLVLPADLEARKTGIMDGWADITLHVSLEKHSPLIKLSAEIDNHARDHRMRLLIPGGLSASCSRSDNQFGSIRRPLRDPAMDIWEAEQWSERPDSIYPFLSYVETDGTGGFTAYTNSIREYEITGEDFDTIALTLFRSVGVLGKEELLRRPGRPSGIKLETPDSQMIKTLHFELAVAAKTGCPARLAKEFLTPFAAYNCNGYHAMKLNPAAVNVPAEYSLLELEDGGAVMSVLKKAEDQDGLIMRLYAGTDDGAEVVWQSGTAVAEVTLSEEELSGTSVRNGGSRARIGSNQIRTFRLELPERRGG